MFTFVYLWNLLMTRYFFKQDTDESDERTTHCISGDTKPFNYEELNYFIDLVGEERSIVSSGTDVSENERSAAWERVCAKFNLGGQYSRDISTLKRKWNQLEEAAEKRRTEFGVYSWWYRNTRLLSDDDNLLDKVDAITSSKYPDLFEKLGEERYEMYGKLLQGDEEELNRAFNIAYALDTFDNLAQQRGRESDENLDLSE